MKRAIRILPCAAMVLLLLPTVAGAQIPREIFYQGVLTDSSGVPKPDGSYSFVFTLFPDSTGTAAVWSAGRTLFVKGGLFYTPLSFPPSLAFDRQYWLEISAAGVTLSPRIPLSSSAYSIASIRSDSAAFADSTRIALTVPNAAITMANLAPSGADTGQVIKWTGSGWAPGVDSVVTGGSVYNAGAGLTLTGSTFSIAASGIVESMMSDTAVTSAKIRNRTITSADIADSTVTLTKIARSGATSGQVIKWDGIAWVPGPDSVGAGGVTYSAGTGLLLTGSVFSIAAGGVTNAMLRDSSISVAAGTGLSGGGSVSPGGTIAISHAPHFGDVMGTDTLTVTGLQGRAVGNALPQPGYVLKWDGVVGRWEPALDNAGGQGGIGGSGADNFIPRFNGATSLESSSIYDSAGSIGIGLSNPQSRLDVNGTVQMTGLRLTTGPVSGFVLTSDQEGSARWGPVVIGPGAVTTLEILDSTVQQQDLGFPVLSRPLTPGVDSTEIATGMVTSADILDLGINRIDLRSNIIDSTRIAPGMVTSTDILDGAIQLRDLSFAVPTRPLSPGVDSTEIATSMVTSADILDLGINRIDLRSNVIDSTKIAQGTVTSTDILDLGINRIDLRANVIDSTKIAQGTVTSTDILDLGINRIDLRANIIDSTRIAPGMVTSTDILNGTIQGSDISTTANVEVGGLTTNAELTFRNLPVGGTLSLLVDGSGRVFQNGSSRRYKTNIRPLAEDPRSVLDLKPVRFNWRTTGDDDIGLIAEEVAAVITDLAVFDQEGRPDGVKYEKVALYLLELVKSQERRIAELESKINRMSNAKATGE